MSSKPKNRSLKKTLKSNSRSTTKKMSGKKSKKTTKRQKIQKKSKNQKNRKIKKIKGGGVGMPAEYFGGNVNNNLWDDVGGYSTQTQTGGEFARSGFEFS